MAFTRIIYNSNNWVSPSGASGKSIGQSFEAISHFGFDEWFFDFDKLIDGYHYSFLQGLKSNHPNNMPIELYTIHRINNIGRQPRYWVGIIDKWEYVSVILGKAIELFYARNGWIKQMKSQLLLAGADVNEFDLVYFDPANSLFNIRFKPSDVKIFPPGIAVVQPNVNNKNRYQLHK